MHLAHLTRFLLGGILILVLLPIPRVFASGAPGEAVVVLNLRGQTALVNTSYETVGELLDRLEVSITGEDVVNHPLIDPVCPGMEVRIDRIFTRRETYTTTVPHEITYCSDDTAPEGSEVVLTQGVDGELLCTADVTYVNGEEVRRRIVSEDVTRPPVTELVGIGSGAPSDPLDPEELPIIGDGYIQLPTGEVLTYTHTATVRATAYTHTDTGCDQLTATGTSVRRGTVAVDPRFIPYGTRMFIMASDGSYVYGLATAEDCGGAIKGDRMDLYMTHFSDCIVFGRRTCTLYFLS